MCSEGLTFPCLVYGCVLGVQVCGLERRLCGCWEALHDVDVRVELLHNRSVTLVTSLDRLPLV